MVIPFILDYLKHYWVANTRHGTHSPFVYKLLDEVIYDFSPKKVYDLLENRRKCLLLDKRVIEVLDLGAGSQFDGGVRGMEGEGRAVEVAERVVSAEAAAEAAERNVSGAVETTKRMAPQLKRKAVKDIAKHSLKSPKLAQVLYRIVANHQVKDSRLASQVEEGDANLNIVELGTCLGLTTAYMAMARPKAHIYTIEGCPQTAALAQENWAAISGLGADGWAGLATAERTGFAADNQTEHTTAGSLGIDLRVGNFDDHLPALALELSQVDILYIDGNHTEEATLRYFEWALAKVHEDSLIIFDDIYWSAGMKSAWEKIKAHPQVTVTIDFFWIGLVYFRKGQAKEHFKIRL